MGETDIDIDIDKGLDFDVAPECVNALLVQRFDVVFVFDMENGTAKCLHSSGLSASNPMQMKLFLTDALDYWVSNLVIGNDRAAVQEFIDNQIHRYDQRGLVGTIEFRMSLAGATRRFSSWLYSAAENKLLFCCVDETAVETTDRCDQQLLNRQSKEALQIAFTSEAVYTSAFNIATGERVSIVGEVISDEAKRIESLNDLISRIKEDVHPDDYEMLLETMVDIGFVQDGYPAKKQTFECRLRYGDVPQGSYRWVRITYMHVFNEALDSTILYVFVIDIDEGKKRLLGMIEKADMDQSTHFLNKAAFERYCERELENKGRASGSNALMTIEISLVGEPFGYQRIQLVEDAATAVARVIRQWHKKDDVVARLADRKFLVCMHAPESRAVMKSRVQSLQQALAGASFGEASVAVNMGITTCRHDCNGDWRLAYDQAEVALGKAMELGNLEAVFYSPDMKRSFNVIHSSAVFIRTFGYFEVFVNQRPIVFSSEKAKELLALLVDRQGGLLSTDEAISYLWENEPANKVTRARFRKVAMRLKNTLEEHGVANIVETVGRKRHVVKNAFQCDLYEFLSGGSGHTSMYAGAYMLDYSWAEVTAAQLEREYWEG